MPKFYCIESTIDMPLTDGWSVRLWIDSGEHCTIIPESVVNNVCAAWNQSSSSTPEDFLQRVAELVPNLNAVQIVYELNGAKVGHIVYTVPF